MTNTDLREKFREQAWNTAAAHVAGSSKQYVDEAAADIEAALVSAYNAGVEAAAVESEKALDAIVGGGPIYTGGGPRALKLPGAP